MKFTFTLTALAALATFSSAAPCEERSVGPSSQVLSPAGGTVIKGTDTGNGGIWLDVQGVNQQLGGTYALTYGVSAELKSGDKTYLLSNGEALNPKTGKITAYLKTPKGACGDFRLVLNETQYYKGAVITFQSAAPLIHIDCAVTP